MHLKERPFGATPLVQDWLAGRAPATDFLPEHPSGEGGYRRRAHGLDTAFDRDRRARVVRALSGGGSEAEGRIRRFLDEGGYLVTTGQQPVLFGGPLYVVYKALTAVALASRLEEILQRPVLPVFWVASEDHDWEEARQTAVLDQDNQLQRIQLPARDPDLSAPSLHRIPLRDGEVVSALDDLLGYLPNSDFAPAWTRLLKETWVGGSFLPQAFEAMLRHLLGSRGLFFIQSHAPYVKDASLPLLQRELGRSAESEAELTDTATRLGDAGYDLQVPILEGATNVFLDHPRGRERLVRTDSGTFRLRRSGTDHTLERLLEMVDTGEARLSPNVLLRPVAEAAALPTLAYVAGPGEAAYMGQLSSLFHAHGVERPVIQPRLSLELVEGKVEKVLDKYGLTSGELARPHHELAGELVREELPDDIRKELGEFRGLLGRHGRSLGQAVKELDPTLEATVDSLRSQGFAQLEEVEKKVVQALKRENEIALAQLEKAQQHLFPGGRPQERVMSPWYYLFRYGEEFLDMVAERARDTVATTPVEDPR